ncbi:hypothetical protein R1sor_007970 [Riccia sorocarpa]|uniref:Protein kinase domain-containing protein n=1 Tax=Riccia sorocarpa TaxID=122646 RepID=A0ABD3HVH1_9MARC
MLGREAHFIRETDPPLPNTRDNQSHQNLGSKMVGTLKKPTNGEDLPLNWFTLKAMMRATSNFALKNCVGQGQNGIVYHGRLPDGTSIAIKKFKPNSADPEKSVLTELKVQQAISQLSHPDVRLLLGVSFDPKDPFIVYEYLPRGSLRQHLQGKKGDHLLNDAYARLNVAIDVANALCQLHYNSRFPIYHRDVKSSNVLVDADHRAKLADMGIAVVVKSDADLNVDVPLGAFGYKCPVYEESGRLDDKSDVYSFGVVLMELATCLTAWDPKRPVTLLANVVMDRLQRGVAGNLIKPGKVAGGGLLMKAVLLLAARCCSLELPSRPRMDEVANGLMAMLDTDFEKMEEECFSQRR